MCHEKAVAALEFFIVKGQEAFIMHPAEPCILQEASHQVP